MNGRVPGRTLLAHMEADARRQLESAAETLALSARAYHRVARVARTIADLDGAGPIGTAHVAEALRYRPQLGGSA